jgi:hypothetical protein
MKSVLTTLVLLFGAFALKAQITVAQYDIKLTADVDDLESIPAVTATSECGDVNVSLDEKTFSGGCLGTLVYTYTFTDDCGNEATAQQFITLTDTTPPVFVDFAPTLTAASADEIPAAVEPTATDNSGKPVKVTLKEEQKRKKLIRIWTAEDQCGNTTVQEQEVTF